MTVAQASDTIIKRVTDSSFKDQILIIDEKIFIMLRVPDQLFDFIHILGDLAKEMNQ